MPSLSGTTQTAYLQRRLQEVRGTRAKSRTICCGTSTSSITFIQTSSGVIRNTNNPGVARKRAAGDQEKEEPTVTRKRAVVGDPDLEVDNSGVNKGSSSSSSSAHPEPQVEEVAPPAPEAEPPAPPAPQEDDVKRSLRNINDKLKDETELYKLHLKHYHMTPKSFRHRTSARKLPKEVYD